MRASSICRENGNEDTRRGGSEEKRGAYLSIAYSAENPLMLFIRVMSFKGRGKRKTSQEGWMESSELSCGRTEKGEKKGLLGGPW